ncbi:MAG: permease [Anaerovorax sp.]|nr:permease [Anaerovorax sp.]
MEIVFLIIALGYFAGEIKFKGIKLGNSAVLLVALFFGHIGFEVPTLIRNFGLVFFVASVGLTAGPLFFKTIRQKAYAYFLIGVIIIATGGIITLCISVSFNIPRNLMVGLLTGALTSTPGLAAALNCLDNPMISVGYGIAYPFGVLGVVLFVQLLPRFMHVSVEKESEELAQFIIDMDSESHQTEKELRQSLEPLEPTGILIFICTVFLGTLFGNLEIPLIGETSISLGMSGGPLFLGIIIGNIRQIANKSIEVPKATLDIMREFGLVLFLAGAGTQAGTGFLQVVSEYGVSLFLVGALITLIPMLIGFLLAYKIFKLNILIALGSICGGMTSTPALGSLITTCKTDMVVASYASTYPTALIFIVLLVQLLL